MDLARVRRLALAVVMACAVPVPGHADDAPTGRAGLGKPRCRPGRVAKCGELRTALRDLPECERRIDLWVEGNALGIQTNGALWYVVVCAAPDIRVLCVTYDKVGDYVQARDATRGGTRTT